MVSLCGDDVEGLERAASSEEDHEAAHLLHGMSGYMETTRCDMASTTCLLFTKGRPT
jgi:hypothetical protein